MSRAADIQSLRNRVAALETGGAPRRQALPFGDARIDAAFPAGGLPLGCWHAVAGEGLELETGVLAGAFAAALIRPLAARGALVWIMRRDDLYAPGLAGLGLPAERLIQVRARDEAQALGALEDALGSPGVAAAVGEASQLDLLGGRRLQLACERWGATGIFILRRPFGAPAGAGDARDGFGPAAATRWSIAAEPSDPPPGDPGLGSPRWRVSLEHCRGGRPGRWIMEVRDGPHPLRVVAPLGDRQLETPQPVRLAG